MLDNDLNNIKGAELITKLAKHFQIEFEPAASQKAVVFCEQLRITVLTSGILRLEYDPQEEFDNRPTQLVWKRKLTVPEFSLEKNEQKLIINLKIIMSLI